MLGLTLREEFKGRRLKGTAIELTNKNNTGATQISAADFLRITYPSHDVLKTIEAAGPTQGRPVTLKGERGQGKTHLMAVLYHAFQDHGATQHWLNNWAHSLGDVKISQIPLRGGMHVISESLHRQRYKYLWDLLFDKHPHGGYCRGKWEGLGDKKPDVPSDEILLELFQHTPTALILDEFQTWYDGLTNTKQYPWRTWAFNFIQILSEIAKEYPEHLVLVVSVRNGNTDAFQQIQRVNPVIVDFKGPSAKSDRLRLLLHRLFENRLQVNQLNIESLIGSHINEYFRLKHIAPAEQSRLHDEFIEAWPYAPHLMDLLEDQVLIATSAQGTRDLIRILADLFKRSGEKKAILTAADFRLDDEDSGITALLDSVANQHHAKLREKALRNLEAVTDAIAGSSQKLPHLEEVIGALWLRSLAEVNQAGADQTTLHVDITRDIAVDDNAFQVELTTIVENSFNIHEDGNRYIFREEENPQAKLISSARNDKLFRLCARGKIAINLRGMEYLQAQDGETDETAYKRMRGKLGTGKHLDETHVLLPQNVPATGGLTQTGSTEPPTSDPGGTDYDGSQFGGGGGIADDPGAGGTRTTQGGGEPGPGGIFGGGSGYKLYSSPATSGLNLLGKVETWGIGTGTQVRSLTLRVDQLTGAQLQELIRKLPDGMTYGIDLEKEEG